MTTITATKAVDVALQAVVPAADYVDAFVTLSPKTRRITINHPGIPFLGSTHVIPLHQIHFLKSAAELDLAPSEYKVWGIGRSFIWWAWDLRRAGFLKRTERERCFVARVEVGWITLWIGFTVEDVERFKQTLEACEWVPLD
jgi:hypothetical protein